ncbi:hypothetical protein E2562_014046 [Oryza meyeriana var. granulata]|uniref:Uncharacterized protein n=1 Tax=Oryza meyeriana var. granulata TaxID=110450 RepID=A0A6G1DJ07_9ORYZ|nr:hypothetical protein E2562_014046 [Oryza meyeriana var. granulata]
MESRARREQEERARGAEACMQLVVADGFLLGTPMWLRAMEVFRNPYYRLFYIEDSRSTEEEDQRAGVQKALMISVVGLEAFLAVEMGLMGTLVKPVAVGMMDMSIGDQRYT